eukprot:CAMPEP_0197593036 /NCGR_PEP_ID=MMETSP1326-20131121/16966_1 /TAXON_ID=1155430 /ORGANISM="Genus nov. species nov., Strain RCC2288" /LENGTH=117 /DNA_ID=CAMNT_0043158899 /DNA_START=35 /DNA_END=388 /DNA_ORIENTATION=-
MECVLLILTTFLGPKGKIDVGITMQDPKVRLAQKPNDHGRDHGYPMQMWAVYTFPNQEAAHNLETSMQALVKHANKPSYANGGERDIIPGIGRGGKNNPKYRDAPHTIYACFWTEEE